MTEKKNLRQKAGLAEGYRVDQQKGKKYIRRERFVSIGCSPALHDLLNEVRNRTHQPISGLCLTLIEEALKARGEVVPPPLPVLKSGPKPGKTYSKMGGSRPGAGRKPATDATRAEGAPLQHANT